jgi:hypothetical protein
MNLSKQAFDLTDAQEDGKLQVLLEANPDVDVDLYRTPPHPCGGSLTSFYMASVNGDTACMKLLLDHGADVNTRSDQGGSCLIYPPMNVNKPCKGTPAEQMQLLLDAGAEVNAVTAKGLVPLWYAMLIRAPDLIFLLQASGADMRLVKADRIPQEYANFCVQDFIVAQNLIDDHHTELKAALTEVRVDTRLHPGLHPAPLEHVLGYLGLSLNKDRVVNENIDNMVCGNPECTESCRQKSTHALLPGASAARYWYAKHVHMMQVGYQQMQRM